MSDTRGIHYELSYPVPNPDDGYYYQRLRQVDENGNLVGIGEQIHRSSRPGSTDGLMGRAIDLDKAGRLGLDAGQAGLGAALRKPGMFARGALGFARDVGSGIQQDYRSWPGTDKPWEPPVDRQAEDPEINSVQPNGPPIRFLSRRVQDPLGGGMAGWAGNLPSGHPDSNVVGTDGSNGNPGGANVGPSQASPFVAGAPPVPFLPPVSQNALGGLPGLIASVAGIDPSNADQPPAGGLLALLQEYMRNNLGGDSAR